MDVSAAVALINYALVAVAAVALASVLADVAVAIYEWLRGAVIGHDNGYWRSRGSNDDQDSW